MHFYQHIFEHVPDALLVVNLNGRIANLNAQAESMFGYPRGELIGEMIELLVPERFAKAHVQQRERFATEPIIRRMGPHPIDFRARRKDGLEFPADIMLSPLHSDSEMYILCAVRDKTEQFAAEKELRQRTEELEALHEQLKIHASRDGLTDLLNRRAFEKQVEWLLRNSARRGASFSLLVLDVDFFKRVNDRFGHAQGDRVLVAVADVLRATCRQNDIAARYGGEEFTIALPDTDARGSLIAAETFRLAITDIDGLPSPISVSIGVATYKAAATLNSNAAGFQNLFNDADRALYAAKNAGRNRVCHANSLPA